MRKSFIRFTESLTKKYGAFRRDRRGSVAIAFSAVVPVALAAIGAAIDYSRLINSQAELQQAVDGAALAAVETLAAGGTTAKATTAAQQRFAVGLAAHRLTATLSMSISGSSPTYTAVATGSGTIGMLFPSLSRTASFSKTATARSDPPAGPVNLTGSLGANNAYIGTTDVRGSTSYVFYTQGDDPPSWLLKQGHWAQILSDVGIQFNAFAVNAQWWVNAPVSGGQVGWADIYIMAGSHTISLIPAHNTYGLVPSMNYGCSTSGCNKFPANPFTGSSFPSLFYDSEVPTTLFTNTTLTPWYSKITIDGTAYNPSTDWTAGNYVKKVLDDGTVRVTVYNTNNYVPPDNRPSAGPTYEIMPQTDYYWFNGVSIETANYKIDVFWYFMNATIAIKATNAGACGAPGGGWGKLAAFNTASLKASVSPIRAAGNGTFLNQALYSVPYPGVGTYKAPLFNGTGCKTSVKLVN